jgi:hypothetical protein
MGLDVHLERFENFTETQWRKNEYEQRIDEAWEKMARNREDDEIPDSEQEVFWQRSREIARAIGLNSDGEDTQIKSIKLPSQKYPKHPFKIGHFYSSNNDSGINRVLSDSIGLDLHSIFNPPDEDYFQPDWNLARNICSKAIRDFTRHIEQHPYSVTPVKFDPDISPAQAEIGSKALALQKFAEVKKQTAREPNSLASWDGDFFLKEPLEVVAVIPGTAEFMDEPDTPCLYVIFRHEHLDFYLQALEIVLETIEYVLGQPDVDKYYLDWSS